MTSFFVPGIPAPQGSKRAFVNRKTGKPILTEAAGEKHKAWRSMVTLTASQHRAIDFDGQGVHVFLDFYLPRPATVSVKRRPRPTVYPDLDKLIRATLDGLTDAGIFKDDAQVVHIGASKWYAMGEVGVGCAVTVRAA